MAGCRIGQRVYLWWKDDRQWYAGKVMRFDSKSGKHMIGYDDGDSEWLDLAAELRKNHLAVGKRPDGAENADKKDAGSAPTAGAEDGVRRSQYVGQRVHVWWKDDQQWYAGKVTRLDQKTGRHLISYEDGDEEWLDLAAEIRKDHVSFGQLNGTRAGGAGRQGERTTPTARAAGKRSDEGSSASDRTSKDPVRFGYEDIGKRVDAWWKDDKQWYNGQVARFDSKSGRHFILYDDGDEEWLDLRVEHSKRRVVLSDRRQARKMMPCPRCMVNGHGFSFCQSQGHQGLGVPRAVPAPGTPSRTAGGESGRHDDARPDGGRVRSSSARKAGKAAAAGAGERDEPGQTSPHPPNQPQLRPRSDAPQVRAALQVSQPMESTTTKHVLGKRTHTELKLGPECVGERVSVYREGEQAWVEGCVLRHATRWKSYKRHFIQYDDDIGDEWRDLRRDLAHDPPRVRFLRERRRPVRQAVKRQLVVTEEGSVGPEAVGRRLRVWWGAEAQWYAGVVTRTVPGEVAGFPGAEFAVIEYDDDGEVALHDLQIEVFQWIPDGQDGGGCTASPGRAPSESQERQLRGAALVITPPQAEGITATRQAKRSATPQKTVEGASHVTRSRREPHDALAMVEGGGDLGAAGAAGLMTGVSQSGDEARESDEGSPRGRTRRKQTRGASHGQETPEDASPMMRKRARSAQKDAPLPPREQVGGRRRGGGRGGGGC